MNADSNRQLRADLLRMINEYHWKWGFTARILNRRYGTNYTSKELQKLYEINKKARPPLAR